MSGLTGTYRLDNRPASPDTLDAMLTAIAHRGPDARAQWADGPIALGHALLQTTPESRYEQQPLEGPAGTHVLVADARIDNRDALLQALALDGDPAEIPDSALILHAYQHWGPACVDHLIGDFAFALWDADRRELFCARDHLGIRPFFYHHIPGEALHFASELKALVAPLPAPPPLDEQRLVDQLARLYVDPEATIYQGFRRLPPAHTLTAAADGTVTTRRYWTLTPDDLPPMTDEAYAARFRELFEEAVRCRLRSLTPVGADLSGGLDSSAVACVARDLVRAEGRGEAVHSFSYTFDATPESDERAYVEEVLDQGGFEPHWLDGDTRGPLTDLDEIYADVLDDYVAGGMHYMIWASYDEAHAAGLRVMLNGFDGDTTVSHGELYLHELARRGDWEQFAREATWLSRRYQEADHKQPFEEMFSSVGALVKQYAYPELERLARARRVIPLVRAIRALSTHFTLSAYALSRRFLPLLWKGPEPTTPPEPTPVLRPDVAERFDVAARQQAAHEAAAASWDTVRDRQQAQFGLLTRTHGLEAMDHYAAHWGLEARLPFMDIRLIQYCLGLPPTQSLRQGWTRWILRTSLAAVLPSSVCWRLGKARMFAANKRALFEQNGPLLRDATSDLGCLQRYLDPDTVQDLYDRRTTLPPADFVRLQRVASCALWARTWCPDLPLHTSRPQPVTHAGV